MKLVKIFGIVMAAHGVAFMFIFAIPGCRSTSKKPAATAPVIGAETSPLMASTPPAETAPDSYTALDTAPVRFSPTRPGSSTAAEVVAPPAATAATTYSVVKGDSLWSIARKHGITVKELTAANKLRADATLKLDQKLVIPGKAAPAPAAQASVAPAATAEHATAPSSAPTTLTHVIKPGETLGGIAKKYQVKVGDIATANNIADPTKIRAGQSLKIPGSQASSATRSVAPSATTRSTPSAAPVAPKPAPAPAPLAPVFESPVAPTPAPLPAPDASPFVVPAPEPSDAPMIRVEESGAPRIE